MPDAPLLQDFRGIFQHCTYLCFSTGQDQAGICLYIWWNLEMDDPEVMFYSAHI